jgi:hypothetical protein
MDFAVQNTSAIVRARDVAAAPAAEAEALRSARLGTVAPQLQVAPPVEAGPVQHDRRHQPDAERGRVVPVQPAAFLSDEPESRGLASGGAAHRYKYKVAHEPDIDRPLLQIVDEKTDQIVLSLPPEQLVRMLEDARALVEDGLKEPHLKRLDTVA